VTSSVCLPTYEVLRHALNKKHALDAEVKP